MYPTVLALGLLLFNLYINDLFIQNNTGNIGYADDTAVFYEADTWHELKNEVKLDVQNWTFKIGLILRF